jgi:phage-related tail protein
MSQCTGYTSSVVDGKVTDAKDFLSMCLHAFGVMIAYRDDPITSEIPDSIPMDTYHVNQIDENKRKLEEVKARTDDEWREELKKSLEKEKAEYEKAKKEIQAEAERIENMRKQIEAWDCDYPITDVKKFALEQLDMTRPAELKWFTDSIEQLEKALTDETRFNEWKKNVIESAENDLKYTIKHADEDIANNKKANEYLAKFKKELEKLG